MSETSGHPPKGRSLRFFIWLAVVSWAIGTAVAALDCLHEADNWRYQFDYLHILGKVLIYSAASMAVFSICFLTRAQIKRVFFWLFSWRMVKRGLKALGVLLCLVAMLYVEENWRGKRAWDVYRHELEAKGEHLDFDYFIPPPVPDEQNFALTPVVASCYSQGLDRNGHCIEPPNTNIVNRLQMDIMRTGALLPDSAESSDTNLPYGTPHVGRWQQAELTDLKAWQFYYRLPQDTNSPYFPHTNEFPVATEPQTPAADVLLALSKYDSAIEELRQSSRMPCSRFPLNYGTNNPARIIFSHLKSLKSCAFVLRLRAIAELENGQPDKALSDMRLMLYLAGSIRNEPFPGSLSERMFITDAALQPVWEGLTRQQWSDDQLTALEQELAEFDALKDYGFAMRSELAWDLKFIEYLRTEYMANSITCMCGDVMWGPTLLYRLTPSGWFHLSARTVARVYETVLPTGAELTQRVLSPQISKRFGWVISLAYRRHYLPDNYLVRMIVPPLDREAMTCARTQAAADMARIACALERYRRVQGGYPEQLDALAPQFIQKLPHDVINGQPYHYRRTENGRFLLYSVGWNGKDDGGVPDDGRQFSPLKSNGDWVWQYPAHIE
jgi:hypothetical protein